MIYQWKGGFPTHGADAQEVGQEVERIRVHNGGALTPDLIVSAAENKGSPMHMIFEWDDSKAAKEFRFEQARSLLRAITITEVADRVTEPVRAFVAVRQEGDQGKSYTSIAAALSNGDTRQQVLFAAKSELQSWRTRYRELRELADLFEVIDRQLRFSAETLRPAATAANLGRAGLAGRGVAGRGLAGRG